jgi:predicted NACHT family NTPase
MLGATVIVGPAACGKTTLLNRTVCGYAKDALRGSPGSMVPYVVRVMALSRWLIQAGKELCQDVLLEYILDAKCGGHSEGLYSHLVELFRQGKLALVFDGLDEAGAKLQSIAVCLSKNLGQSYAGRMIISSRESLLDEQLFRRQRFQMLQIQPLTEEMQDDVVRRRFHGTRHLQSHQVEGAMAAFKEQVSIMIRANHKMNGHVG